MSRQQMVRLLLLSMHDYLPTATVSTSLLASVPGAGESLYQPCVDCAGTGRQVGKGWAARPCEVCKANPSARKHHGCHVCDACQLNGEKRGRAKEPWDAYTGVKLTELEQETVNARIEKKFLLLPDIDSSEEGWLRRRDLYWEAGSYAELHRALERLRDRSHWDYEMLMHWVSSQQDKFWTWSDGALGRIDGTIAVLDGLMPAKIRVPGWVIKRAKDERNTSSGDRAKVRSTGPLISALDLG